MESYLWGEIKEPRNAEWDKVVPKEIGKLVILSAIKPELPKVKQPQPDEDVDQEITIPPEHSTMEPNVLYTIKLLQHARQVSELIRAANSMDEEPSLDITECSPLPEPPDIKIKYKEAYPLRYVAREDSPFILGNPINLPQLGKEITKEILYKCVATLCAHAGYESAMQSSLQVLTDVADDFLKRFTCLLRYAVDRDELRGHSGFPDAMERVFYEMGFGSMVCLHDYYQLRVLRYRDQCREQCETLLQQYQAVLPTIKREHEEVVQFKTEIDSEENIPEIHFPMDEGDCEDELQSSLEPGFQMLHSLEQEVQLQSMEQDEGGMSAGDSPQGIETLPPGSEAWFAAIKAKTRKKKPTP